MFNPILDLYLVTGAVIAVGYWFAAAWRRFVLNDKNFFVLADVGVMVLLVVFWLPLALVLIVRLIKGR
jgi:hypothetical protein